MARSQTYTRVAALASLALLSFPRIGEAGRADAPPGATASVQSPFDDWSGAEPSETAITALRACATAEPGKLPVQLALRHYVKNVDPKANRYLIAAGTDSSLSESGEKTLQEFGPTYYYAGSEAAKAKVRDRLLGVGPYPALLVVRRSSAKPTSVRETVRLGGYYVTGQHDGKIAPSRIYTFTCGAKGWTMTDNQVENAS